MKKHKGSMISYLNPATQSAAVQRSVYRVENIDAEKIIPNEKNFYSIEGIEEMANSLAVSDHMAPLEVVANGDGTYRLISGERRLSATLCRIRRGEIDRADLPCHVLPAFTAKGSLTAEQMEMLSIIFANNYRQKTVSDQLSEMQQLEPIARVLYDEAKERGELTDANGRTMKFRTFFAEHVLAISESTLQRLQSLSQLTDAAREAFEEGRISKSVAAELASLEEEQQDSFIASVQVGEYSGTSADLKEHLKASCDDPPGEGSTAEVFVTPTDTAARTSEVTGDAAFVEEKEPYDDLSSKESPAAYDFTSAVTEDRAADESAEELVSVDAGEPLAEVYEETQGDLVAMIPEEEEEQEEVSTQEMTSSANSEERVSEEELTPKEAANTLLRLIEEMQQDNRTQDAAALVFALQTMKYRYAWINDFVEKGQKTGV